MKKPALAAVILMLLPAIAQANDRGWYFSRANCLGVNESFVWKGSPFSYPARMIVPLPLPGLVKIPGWRRATGWHYHKYNPGLNHYVESSPTLQYTWRAHAGHFPTLEAFPVVTIRWVTRTVVRYVTEPIRGGGRVRGEGPRTRTRMIVTRVRVPVLVADHKPWRVEGTHYERIGGRIIVKSSSATGCNWGDTFNSM